MKRSHERCDVVMFLGMCDESCCSMFKKLWTVNKFAGTPKQRITIVQLGGHKERTTCSVARGVRNLTIFLIVWIW